MVDEEDVTGVVGDVFFVYATDDCVLPADGGDAPDEDGGDAASVAGEDGVGGEPNAETTSYGIGGGDARDDTSGSDEETVGDAERASSGEPRSGPGRIAIFALGAGTLLVANGLLARWIVG